ncbi:hypothetical protein Tco_0486860 [Tanacetum coccineum]
MCNYLKNMEGYKLKDLMLKEFDSIQEMFDRAFKRVEDDKETSELKQCLEIIPDEEEVTIDAIPLAVKSPNGVSTAQRLQRNHAKCLLLLVHNCSAKVNTASENMLEVTTASEYQVNAANAPVMRTASTAAKPYQGDSSEFYLITGNLDGRSYWIKTSKDSKPHAHT